MQRSVKLGMALFLASESVFFLMLILVFVIFRDESLKTAAESLNFPLTSLFTACLFASSFTAWRAAQFNQRQEGGSPRFWIVGTVLLGAVFFFGQGSEYLRILHSGVTVSQGLFGTTFFTLAGIHGLHVLIGILLLAASPARMLPAVAAFWYFVDGVWIVIFCVVYLWTFL